MGIIIVMILITCIFSLIWYIRRDYGDMLSEFVCPVVSLVGSVLLVLLLCMIAISRISIPANIAHLNETYKAITFQIKTMPTNEVSRKLLIDQIKDWNSELKQNVYYHNNVWTNVFFPVDYSGYEYIEIEEIQWTE